ncbi:hypothetical protein DAEQUDRAFT_724849 [Daedalea quercina L-15889]|uniref:Uncharacterized protein n=1 Tax=Daedalea quercina L-15889 TaxID=1314783 RepID=A0A165RGN0_9APHY|nr:hypothetical protein DAEQUDRAFT_724849 [Daedalea quercina L-15889]
MKPETAANHSTSAFHAILQRHGAAEQLRNRRISNVSQWPVAITFHLRGNGPFEIGVRVMATIKSHIVVLFAPWLHWDILRLSFDPDPG